MTMTKLPLDHKRTNIKQPNRTTSPKLSIYLFPTFVLLFILFHIQTLISWPFIHDWQSIITNSRITTTPIVNISCPAEDHLDINSTNEKLRDSVTFLPLKDIRFTKTAQQDHTWFMSSMYDSREEGEVQHQQFPSQSSKGRILCLKGRDWHDGSWNYYALAYPEALPHNATLMNGTTFIAYNHYSFGNIWHGFSAVLPFVAWHIKSGCVAPSRWILYYWGELRNGMAPYLTTLMGATFSKPVVIETFEGVEEGSPVCFEQAVVMRHYDGGMSRERRVEVYDLMRCKAREYCKVVPQDQRGYIRLTLLLRTGPRSFKNESEVIRIFQNECNKVQGCRLMVAHSNNLTFCEQVKLMSETDIVASPHGAQLTNLFLMDRESSVMEFFPKGWRELAGAGQYVFHWMASRSGMKHQGEWRDPVGEHCPYPDNDRRCMSIYKEGRIGHNETYLSEWSRNVLNEMKMKKFEEAKMDMPMTTSSSCVCG